MSQEVHDYIASRPIDWQIPICERLDTLVHATIPDAEERIQYGKPHYKKNGKYAAVIGTAKEHVSFTIFNATDVEGPAGLFEDGPPERKTIKIRKGREVDYDLVGQLLGQATATL